MTIDLATLDGSDGFRLDGIDRYDSSGRAVASAGDVNGDGIDDIIVSAPSAGPNIFSVIGESYVIFGRLGGFDATLSLAALDGTNGFRIDGIDAGDFSGTSVASAGDVNGDGLGDLIIGAFGGDPNGTIDAGESYVVFGRSDGFDAVLSLAALDGSAGFRIDGIDEGDSSGTSVASAGDVNGDGIDDLIIGAPGADQNRRFNAGESYVVFGNSTGFDATLPLSDLNGRNGFRLVGIDRGDYSGRSVASAGDVNGDGLGDLIIGALDNQFGFDYQGQGYVVFGRSTGFAAALALGSLNGANGFRIDSARSLGGSAISVASAGDVNGDDIDDLIIGGSLAQAYSGSSFVVFGTAAGFDATLSLGSLDGSNGFRLDGLAQSDRSGFSVASAGDFNGDGIDDLLIGAPGADPGGRNGAGATYVVFGQTSGFGARVSLGALDGPNGFRLDGIGEGDGVGAAVAAAGDVNSDGIDDLLVGASGVDLDSRFNAGAAYVVFGIDFFGAISDANAAANRLFESAAPGTAVGLTARAFATAAPGSVRYALADDADGRFAIDATSGVVTLAGPLDFESATRHQIIVRATGPDGDSETAAFVLQVRNAAEPLGAITDANIAANQVREDAAPGTTVNIRARALDPDSRDSVSYALTDSADGRFAIDAITGRVTVAGPLDFETARSHQITILATSSGGDSQSADFTIAVVNANDRIGPVSDRALRANRVAENAAPGTQVGLTALAIDPDVRDTVRYAFADSALGRFAIDAVTGVVTVVGRLDFETDRSHQITIRATSSDFSNREEVFTITVTDADDPLSSVFDVAVSDDRVAEDAAIGARTGLIARAFDQDRGDRISYALTDDAGGRFAIDARTGVVTVAGALDFEAARSHQVTVQATSSGGDSQTASFVIAVTDVADGGPVPGTSGADRLVGSAIDDIFTPRAGSDVMIGRGGDDVFVFAEETRNSVAERDTITDFAPGDLLDLGDARIFREIQVNGDTVLILDADRDQIRLLGLADFDPLTMLA